MGLELKNVNKSRVRIIFRYKYLFRLLLKYFEMENSISDLLSNYCDQLIGVAPEDKIKKKKKKEKISNSISDKNENDVSGEGESKLSNSKEVEILKKIPKTDENSNVNSSFLE